MQAVVAHVPALAAPVAGDAMPNPLETRQFLDVEMEQFSGALALIAADGSLRLQRGQATDPEAGEPIGHRRTGHRELLGDLLAGQAIFAPQPFDGRQPGVRRAVGHGFRLRRAVFEPCRPFLLEPFHPFAGGFFADSEPGGSDSYGLAFPYPPDHFRSTKRRHSRILVWVVHP